MTDSSPSPNNPLPAEGPSSIIEIRNQIRKMKGMKFAFGRGMATMIIHQFQPLLDPGENFEDPKTMRLMRRCSKAYRFFSKWSQKSHILWIKAHIHLRLSMIYLLSSGGHIYTMGEFDIETWIESVYVCIRRVISGLFRSPPSLQESHFNPFQTAIDALCSLIEVMNKESCRQEKFHDYYTYLIYLSQRTCLPPSSLCIDPKSIHVDRESIAGIGVTADVFRCNVAGRSAAAKMFRIFNSVKKRDKRKFLNEAILLRLLPHPHIVPSLGIVMSETMLSIISPWMKNGDIVSYTKKHPRASKKNLLEEVADGLHFLQQYNLVHGDLKGSNVLINDEGKACIADLGASRLLEASTQNSTFKFNHTTQPFSLNHSNNPPIGGNSLGLSNLTSLSGMSNSSAAGTYRYMSPERILPGNFGMNTARATFSSDVFSFGMLVYEVYAGHAPFHGICFETTAGMRIVDGHRPMRPKSIEDEVWLLATRCWHRLPEERPLIFEVYNTLAILP